MPQQDDDEQTLDEAVAEMGRAVSALALAVPPPVYEDVAAHWANLRAVLVAQSIDLNHPDWKQNVANAADAAWKHPIVDGAIGDILENLGCAANPMARVALWRLAAGAAQVTRMQMAGLDPELLRMTADEAVEQLAKLASLGGSNVHVVVRRS